VVRIIKRRKENIGRDIAYLPPAGGSFISGHNAFRRRVVSAE